MADRWPCPYKYCGAIPVLDRDGNVRRHRFEGVVCPGSGFNIRKPAQREHDAMSDRESHMWD